MRACAIILAIFTACLLLCLRMAEMENRLQTDELQWAATDGEVKALGNKGYEGEH